MDSRHALFSEALFALSGGENLDKTIELVKQTLEKYQEGLGEWVQSYLDDYWERLEMSGLPEYFGHEALGAIKIMRETNEKYALNYPSFDVSIQLMKVLYLIERHKDGKRIN